MRAAGAGAGQLAPAAAEGSEAAAAAARSEPGCRCPAGLGGRAGAAPGSGLLQDEGRSRGEALETRGRLGAGEPEAGQKTGWGGGAENGGPVTKERFGDLQLGGGGQRPGQAPSLLP
ncbi:hypothetical protein VULLAG_LOCUS1485 [Vulpes lagopus]